jgi:hypothetical protein
MYSCGADNPAGNAMHGVAFFYPSVDEGKRLRRVCDWDDTNVVALEGFDKGARPGSKGRAHLSPKPGASGSGAICSLPYPRAHPEGLRAGQWPGSWVWRELFEGGGTSIVRLSSCACDGICASSSASGTWWSYGRARTLDCAHHNHALGAPLCSGVRAPMEPLRAASGRFVACGRDLM